MMQNPMPNNPTPDAGPAGTQGVEDKLKSMRSPFNPADMSMMAQDGEVGPNTSVRDFLAKLGVDVDGPVTQLAKMFSKGMANANPLQKMMSLGQQGPSGGGQPPAEGAPPQTGRPPMVPRGSLDNLLAGR